MSETPLDWVPVVSLSHRFEKVFVEGSPDEIAPKFHELVKKENGGTVFCLSAKDYAVEVLFWNPNTCQGQCFPAIVLHYGMSRTGKVTWTRNPQEYENSMVAAGLSNRLNMESAYEMLFDIVLSAGIELVQIRSVGHVVAAQVLARRLSRTIPSMKWIEFKSDEFGKKKDKDRLLYVFVQPSSSLETVRFEGLDSFSRRRVAMLFRALKDKPKLQHLFFQRDRHIHTWHKDFKRLDGNEIGIPLKPMIPILTDPGCAIRVVDLSGNPLSHQLQFATALNQFISLESLFLRDTGLDETTLVELLCQLGQENCTLLKLDVSHNRFSLKVMEELVLSLQKNRMLERLTAEHCEINIEQVTCLANGLPKCKGLRHLFLNGNEFTWKPLLDGKQISMGASLLVESVEHNESLQTLEMGDVGHLGSFGRVCCTCPTYESFFDEDRLHGYLERNLQAYQEYRRVRLRESIVKTATLLLGKMEVDTNHGDCCAQGDPGPFPHN